MIRSYLGAVSSAVGQGALTAVWVGANGLPKGQRRMVRAGTTLATVAYGWLTTPGQDRAAVVSLLQRRFGNDKGSDAGTEAAAVELNPAAFRDLRAEQEAAQEAGQEAGQEAEQEEKQNTDWLKLTVTGFAVAGSLGMLIGRKQLERRWLARLQRNGHPHPHRGLALRVGALAVAATLPSGLFDVYEKQREAQRK